MKTMFNKTVNLMRTMTYKKRSMSKKRAREDDTGKSISKYIKTK